jgi:hypothetical protein
MSKSRHTEAQTITALKQVEAAPRIIVCGDVLEDSGLIPPCKKIAVDPNRLVLSGSMFWSCTKRSGSGKVRGRSKTVLTTIKMAVFTPMPSAYAAIAVRANAGLAVSTRKACLVP